MAIAMLPFRPAALRGRIKAVDNRRSRKTWWAPLFGFPSDPDYLNSDEKKSKPARSRFAPGSFTEEKAKQLRRMTNDATSFHDPMAMYHSAISSRLASDFSDRDNRFLENNIEM